MREAYLSLLAAVALLRHRSVGVCHAALIGPIGEESASGDRALLDVARLVSAAIEALQLGRCRRLPFSA